MIRLPAIESIEHDQARVTLRFVVPGTVGYFDGHFPGVPLLPGVVQVGWAVRLAELHLGLTGRFRALAGVKFMRVIQPGDQVLLTLDRSVAGELSFEYRNAGEPSSGGRVLFH